MLQRSTLSGLLTMANRYKLGIDHFQLCFLGEPAIVLSPGIRLLVSVYIGDLSHLHCGISLSTSNVG